MRSQIVGFFIFFYFSVASVAAPLSNIDLDRCGIDVKCIFVSPLRGKYRPDGSLGRPFYDLESAKYYSREVRGYYSGTIYVILRGGVYRLQKPILLDSALDGGSGDGFTIYSSYPGERAIISGMLDVNNDIKREGNVLSFHVGFDHRQLYIDGIRARKARYPSEGNFLFMFGSDSTGTPRELNEGFSKGDFFFKTDGVKDFIVGDDDSVEIHTQREFSENILKFKYVERLKGFDLVHFVAPSHLSDFLRKFPKQRDRQTFFFENSPHFLDSALSWTRSKSGLVRVKVPPDWGDDAHTIQVPHLDMLLGIGGGGDIVKNVGFVGVDFQGTSWVYDGSAFVPVQANITDLTYNNLNRLGSAVKINGASDVFFYRNRFYNIGGNAVESGRGIRHVIFDCNEFSGISGAGLVFGADLIRNPSEAESTSFVTVSNNIIRDIGLDYPGAVALFGGYVKKFQVYSNYFENIPYSGISIGWGWSVLLTEGGGHLIRDNFFKNFLTKLVDGGAIYFLSNQTGSVVSNNRMMNFGFAAGAVFLFNAGVYLDQGVTGVSVLDNSFDNLIPYSGVSPKLVFDQKGNSGNFFISNSLRDLSGFEFGKCSI